MITDLIVCYTSCIEVALPVTLVFFFGNLIVSTILTAAFGGGFYFGRK